MNVAVRSHAGTRGGAGIAISRMYSNNHANRDDGARGHHQYERGKPNQEAPREFGHGGIFPEGGSLRAAPWPSRLLVLEHAIKPLVGAVDLLAN